MLILFPLLARSPPSCGDVSSTMFANFVPTVVLSAAMSTPSTVPETTILPVTSTPPDVVVTFSILL